MNLYWNEDTIDSLWFGENMGAVSKTDMKCDSV